MNTEIAPITEASLALAKQYISAGELVAFHTETVYGLGANALSSEAVAKIFAVKGRPSDNPLIVHVHEGYDLSRLIDGEPPYAEKLRRAFLPGPLTMVYPSTGKVSPLVSCGLNTLAVRVPSSPAAQAFLKAVDLPIAAPSANISKHVSAVTAGHVYDDFAGKIPLILDGGDCTGGIESTVLDCTGTEPKILRAGLVTREMIASVVGVCGVYEMKKGEKPKSPGLAYKHYCPKCRTALVEEETKAKEIYFKEQAEGGRPYFLCDGACANRLKEYNVLSLGDTPREMARRLYRLLREAEKVATLLIAIAPTQKGDEMDGVMNRLTRACRSSEDEV